MSTIDEKLQIKLSAWCDGELDGAGCADIERLLAEHPELAAIAAQYRKLDAAAAALPAPRMSERASRQVFDGIMARAAQEPAASAQLVHDVPAVSGEKWDRVWSDIRIGVAAHARGDAASTTGNVLTNFSKGQSRDAEPVAITPNAPHAGNVVQTTRWRWFSAAGIAAMLVGALAIHFFYKPVTPADNTVAIDLPSTSDNDRYEISVEYSVHGDAVVCYYLKPEARGNDTDRDWRWLPD